jgi:hypothetical protein
MPANLHIRLILFVILILTVAPSLHAQTPTLTCSPAPCVLPNVQVSQSSFILPYSLSLDPADGQHLVTGESDLSCTTAYVTNDGGATWTNHCSKAGGWPAFAFGLNAVINGAGIGPDQTCAPDCDESVGQFSTSSDNGVTWSKPVRSAPHALGFGVSYSQIQVDTNPSSPHFGAIYVSALQYGGAPLITAIGVSHSSDNGATWKLVPVDSTQNAPSEDFESHLAIGSDGTVYVTWLRCPVSGGGTSCPGQAATLLFSKSIDGGNTWSAPSLMGNPMLVPSNSRCGSAGIENLPNTCWFTQDVPVIAIDNSGGTLNGRLYGTFYNWTGSFMQVVLVYSTDGGTSWSTPIAVQDSRDNHDQFAPSLSVSSSGILGVTWQDRFRDPANVKYQPYAAFSNDGGATFFRRFVLATVPSNPRITTNAFTYPTTNLWSGNTFYALWQDTRTGESLAWFGGVVLK